MRVGCDSVVRGVRCVFCAESAAGSPALRCEDFVAEAVGVVRPGCVLRVVGYFGATECFVSARGVIFGGQIISYFFGPARPILRECEGVFEDC